MPHHHASPDGDAVIRWAWRYDLLTKLLGSRGRRLRADFVADLAVASGDRVLDVGCGPGELALALAARVAPGGSAVGIDPSPAMVARASAKAARRGAAATFEVAFAQRLPFTDDDFDAVACTLALHHVAAADRESAVAEMHRVLTPGGRLLIAEFKPGSGPLRHRLPWAHQHGDTMEQARELCAAAGFVDLAVRDTRVKWMSQLTAVKSARL